MVAAGALLIVLGLPVRWMFRPFALVFCPIAASGIGVGPTLTPPLTKGRPEQPKEVAGQFRRNRLTPAHYEGGSGRFQAANHGEPEHDEI